jgi:hypothetical protein
MSRRDVARSFAELLLSLPCWRVQRGFGTSGVGSLPSIAAVVPEVRCYRVRP